MVSVPLKMILPLFAALAVPAIPKLITPRTANVRESFFMLTTFLVLFRVCPLSDGQHYRLQFF
ncbi:hypothetical protein KPSA3_01677 [Pseudomonas syringae pv. actinidiae]|uniref:Uncharacterized protein n=1 Tax=Pseudomonas syringae pv. actinidiae TaxID=103796 RepID=A0AAN4Q253_PSESF|nr:hypothetical protein KPSA3_01677 [Pseudomonas syringae pv. actinidiae]